MVQNRVIHDLNRVEKDLSLKLLNFKEIKARFDD